MPGPVDDGDRRRLGHLIQPDIGAGQCGDTVAPASGWNLEKAPTQARSSLLRVTVFVAS